MKAKLLGTIVTALSALTMLAMSSVAGAQTYPNKPIKIIVPYPAGDLADVISRLIGEKISAELKQSIVVENKPGASGLLGLQALAQTEPDGYTFAMGQMGSLAVAPITNKWTINVLKDFKPVAMTFTNYMMLVTNAQFPPKTLSELIAYSKTNPGKVRVATNGEGGFPHLTVELLKQKAGFNYDHIPYKGGSQIMPDLIAGRVEATVLGFSSLYPQVQAGRLNAIAVTGKNRPATAPEVATIGETVQGYESLGWFGLIAPKNTPDDRIKVVNDAVNKALAMPAVLEQAKKLGLVADPGSPAQFAKTWQQDYDKWAGIIKSLNLDNKK
ncbi:Bug family tripartite tricarboxylate transporter substrate binding protein [Zwartia vadi]|uniref:Bug family tripartite tricarboxylate transporter substrate binding protein n=1 Tax=Zwartia vadi TaxID=3058168 RepID=UPI0025B50F6A|nr:tripartite tricarboxylate transporter substrate binding protein [Zwartia vadi]MDN3986153.1 tripartite tricarboxylate transporter substrate binding protein [Zwartia vadi]